MKITSVLTLAAAVALLQATASSAQKCDQATPGKVCLADCAGNGFFVTAPQLISSIKLGQTFQLDFDDSGNPLATSAGVQVGLKLPESLQTVDLDFTGAKARINVGTGGGSKVGVLSIPDFVKAGGTSLGGSVGLDMERVNFSALDDAGFQDLFATITRTSGTVTLELEGFAGNKATVRNAGDNSSPDDPSVCLDYVTFTATSELQGLGGLKEAKIEGLPSIRGGSPDTGIELEIKLTVTNPSNVILNLKSDVTLDLTYNGQKCGTVVLPNMVLAIGANQFTAKSFIKPDPSDAAALAATKELMSRFTGKQESQVTVRNGSNTRAPVLNRALASLEISQTLPANQEGLIKGTSADVSSLSYKDNSETSFTMMAGIEGYNPFDTAVSIVNIQSTLSYNGKPCLTSNSAIDGFVLPAKGSANSPKFPVVVNSAADPAICGRDLVVGTLTNKDIAVDVSSTLTLDIGGYKSQIDYNQSGVKVSTSNTACSGPRNQAYCLFNGRCQDGDGLQLPMPIPLIKSVDLADFKLEFDPKSNPDVPLASSSVATVGLDVPGWLKFVNIQFSGVESSIQVGGPDGSLVAEINSGGYDNAGGGIEQGAVTLGINKKPFKYLNDVNGLKQLLKGITLASGPVPIHLKGSANNQAAFPDSQSVCLKYISFDVVSTSIQGLGGLQDTKITKVPVVKNGTPDTGVELEVEIEINNPANIELVLNTDVVLEMFFENQRVGTVTLQNFKLGRGKNTFTKVPSFVKDDGSIPSKLAVKKLFGQFTAGVASTVVVKNGKAAGLPILDDALGAVSIEQVLPAQKYALLDRATANLSGLKYADQSSTAIQLPSTITALNPFDSSVSIGKIKSTLFYNNKACITAETALSGFSIAPGGSAESPAFDVTLDGSLDPVVCGRDLVVATLKREDVRVDVTSSLDIAIGGFPSILDYNQTNVPVKAAGTECGSQPDAKHYCINSCSDSDNGLQLPMPVPLIKGLDLADFVLDFDPNNNPDIPLASTSKVDVTLDVPAWLKYIDFTFNGVQSRIQIAGPVGPALAEIVSDVYDPASGSISQGGVQLALEKKPFKYLQSPEGLKQLLRGITLAPSSAGFPIHLKGIANNKAKFPDAQQSDVCLKYISFDVVSTSVRGLGGLKNTKIVGIPIIKSGNVDTGVELAVTIEITNDANVELNTKTDIDLEITFEGTKVGFVRLPNFSLKKGLNRYEDVPSFVRDDGTDVSRAAVKKLFGQFTGGIESDIVVGNGKAKGLPLLDAALAAISIPQKLPASKFTLLSRATADVSSLSYTDNSQTFFDMQSTIDAINPFDTSVGIQTIKSTLQYGGKDCIVAEAIFDNFSLPAKGASTSPKFKVTVKSDADPQKCGVELVTGTLLKKDVKVNVTSTLGLNIGGYLNELDYQQPDVTVDTTGTNCAGNSLTDKQYCIGVCGNTDGFVLPMPIPLIKSIDLPNFALEFDQNGAPFATVTGAKVGLDVPGWLSYIDLQFQGVTSDIILADPATGLKLARIASEPFSAAKGSISSKAISLDINKRPFEVLLEPGVRGLLKAITLTPGPKVVRLDGIADNKVTFPAPYAEERCLSGVQFKNIRSTIIGLGGLKDTVITAIPKVVSGNPTEGIKLSVPLKITNPSTVALYANRDITLNLSFNNVVLGTVVLPNFRLNPGVNEVVATSFVHPDPTNIPALLATKQLFSQFVGGIPSAVVVGNGKAAGLPILDDALGALSIPQTLPPQTDKLIIDATAYANTLNYPDPNDGFLITMQSILSAYNPFDVPVVIVGIDATLTYKGAACVFVKTQVSGFVIPPKSQGKSPSLLTTIKTTDPICDEFVQNQLFGETALVSTDSTLTIVVGSYPSQISYKQDGVSVSTDPINDPPGFTGAGNGANFLRVGNTTTTTSTTSAAATTTSAAPSSSSSSAPETPKQTSTETSTTEAPESESSAATQAAATTTTTATQ
ncbi:hypothetical protein HDU96_009296 [Phlyctochytrium bullatum]|nr:hypothetical protein HDU96_009296 [Phlyctochytrium bullatum]